MGTKRMGEDSGSGHRRRKSGPDNVPEARDKLGYKERIRYLLSMLRRRVTRKVRSVG